MAKVSIGQAFDLAEKNRPPQIEFDAIWDTGASASVITAKVVEACSLKPTGIAHVQTARGEFDTNTYLVSMGLPNGVGFCGMRVSEGIIADADILIGMDVIAGGDFAVTGFERRTVCSYRYPSMERIDFVRELDDINARMKAKHPPNSPCYCGSGKKFKKCHGAR